jgi:phage terminase large subunit GpA-like protein
MDAFTDPEVEEIDVMSGSQVAKSTAIQNMIGYCIDQDPGPAMYVVPREKDVDYATQKMFKPMINLSNALRSHTTGKPRDLLGDFFTFDRMTLYFAWAGSPAEMAQKSIRYLFFDEPDKYPPFAGKEANPIDLAEKRTRTYWDRKIVKMCTPTTVEGYIYSSFLLSNKQRFYCPCPHCGEFKVWKFGQLKIPKMLRDPDEIIEKGDVWYECEVCAERIYEDRKGDLVAAGIWLPEGQIIDAEGNIKGRPKRSKRHSGFKISALVSPFHGVSWPQIMADWFRANTSEGIALGKLLDFHNATLGEPFRETGKKLKASEVRKLTAGISRATVPEDSILLVAGADYHKSMRGIVRIDYEVRAFSYDLKNYVISTGSAPSFEQLDKEVLMSPFPWSDGADNTKRPWLAVMVMFIDSKFKSDDVYDYCRRHPGLAIPTIGLQTAIKPLHASDLETATERRLGRYQRRKYRGMQLINVNTTYFKDQVTSWVEPVFDDKGKIIADPLTSFYDEIPSYWFTEFTNEHKVKVRDRRGNTKWLWQPVTTGAPTHSLDTAVLSAAAGYYKNIHYKTDPNAKKPAVAAGRTRKRTSLAELQRKKRMR